MRRDRERLNDILDALDWVAKAIAERTEADFLSDEVLCCAVSQKLINHCRRTDGAAQARTHGPLEFNAVA